MKIHSGETLRQFYRKQKSTEKKHLYQMHFMLFLIEKVESYGYSHDVRSGVGCIKLYCT